MFRRHGVGKLLSESILASSSSSSSVLMMDGPKFARKINEETKTRATFLWKNHLQHLDESSSSSSSCTLCNVSVHHLSKQKPTLVIVSVEHDDPALNFMIEAYRVKVELNASEADVDVKNLILPTSTSQTQLEEHVAALNANPDIHAISLQRPIPPHLDAMSAISQISICKEVDGLNHLNAGLLHSRGCNTVHYPCSALAVKKILEHLNVNIEDQRAVVIGTSNVAGRPVSEYLLKYGAIITTFGAAAPEDVILETIAESDIVVTACGQPGRFRGSDFRKGAIVIDFGLKPVELTEEERLALSRVARGGNSSNSINITNDDSLVGVMNLGMSLKDVPRFKLVGDVAVSEAIDVCSHVVAPENGTMSVTSAVLLENTLRAYELCIAGEVGNDVLKGNSFLWKMVPPPINHPSTQE